MIEPYYSEGGITIYCADCRDVLPQLGPVDLVLTDPPYGIGEKWTRTCAPAPNGNRRLTGKGETWDDAPIPDELLRAVIVKGTYAIVFGGNYYTLPASRQWLIWDKCQAFSGSDAELAWSNLPGVVRIFRLSRIDAYANKARFRKEHPAEKPISLMAWCILQAPNIRTILDPFMGVGPTLCAAKDLGRKAIGIEISEEYCRIAVQRLQQEVFDFAALAQAGQG